jgi:ubiquinone/menaquinone biosynthesis C-methylase UbiE
VADIGCGAGATLEHLEGIGCRPVGLDCSDTLLGEAARRSVAGGLVGGRAEYLPFRNGSFDALFCECTLSILDDRPAALKEFARVLKEGAFLIISDVFARGAAVQGQEVRPDTLPAQGFLARTGLATHLTALGFSLLVWEEHDRLLREFAARMVLAGQCLPDAWRRGQGEEKDRNGRRGISYFLLVARKQGAFIGAGA